MKLSTKELLLLKAVMKEKITRDHLSPDDEKIVTEILIKINVELGQ